MNEPTPSTALPPSPVPALSHRVSYPRFVWSLIVYSTDGHWSWYAWMTLLTALALVGLNAWAEQVANGMILTNMTDHVSWGIYIANFVFLVGLAAGSAMMVIPGYLYRNREMHDASIIGELLAIASIVMCLLFVTVDLGRPDRVWHMFPGVGRFNFPFSILTWDVIVLTGYLLLNLHICGYQLYIRWLGRTPDKRWYVPFVFLSIVWAISIHTVTAFLFCGLGSRPFWNSALLAPRFIVSAFVTGPVFIILTLQVLKRFAGVNVGDGPTRTLINIVRITILVNLFMAASEFFTEFYTGGAHTAAARYLWFGLHGHNALVPWIWTGVALNVLAAIIFIVPAATRRGWLLTIACLFAFAGIWIEKGMGLVIPGFVPSTLHEVVEYTPSLTEWKIVVGIWAAGLGIYSVLLKIAVGVLRGDLRLRQPKAKEATS